MLNIAIVDDEVIQIELLSEMVSEWAHSRANTVNVETFNGSQGYLFSETAFDILLLDIQMNGQSGIELAKHIRETDERLVIVFITGLDDFICEGYEVSALHYLIKPVKAEKLIEVLDKACQRLKIADKTLLLETDDGIVRVRLADIVYIEAFAHEVVIHMSKAQVTMGKGTDIYTIKRNIGHIEDELNALEQGMFVRCHRSYIVGIRHIKRIMKSDAELDSGELIPLSRRMYSDVNRAFIEYYKALRK